MADLDELSRGLVTSVVHSLSICHWSYSNILCFIYLNLKSHLGKHQNEYVGEGSVESEVLFRLLVEKEEQQNEIMNSSWYFLPVLGAIMG